MANEVRLFNEGKEKILKEHADVDKFLDNYTNRYKRVIKMLRFGSDELKKYEETYGTGIEKLYLLLEMYEEKISLLSHNKDEETIKAIDSTIEFIKNNTI